MTIRKIVSITAAVLTFSLLLCGQQAQVSASENKTTKASASSPADSSKGSSMFVRYYEVVTNDVDAMCATYEKIHGVTFSSDKKEELGNARIAIRNDGSMLSVRAPLAEHDTPIIRTYIAVDDLDAALEEAEAAGATIAYRAELGDYGTFAIYIHDGTQHGLWQN